MLWKDSRWLVCSTGESLAMSLRSCVLVNLSFNSLYAAFPEKRVFVLINVCCLIRNTNTNKGFLNMIPSNKFLARKVVYCLFYIFCHV